MLGDICLHIFVGVLLLMLYIAKHPVQDLIATGIVTLWMAWLVYRKTRSVQVFIYRKTNAEIYHRTCDLCDGCGVTMLDGTIIPKDLRTYERTAHGWVRRPKIANTKACDFCLGMGRVWIEEGTVRPIAAKRGWFDRWQ